MPICLRPGCCVELIDGVCPRCNPLAFRREAAATDAEVAARAMETVRQVGPPPGVPFEPIGVADPVDDTEAELEAAFARVSRAMDGMNARVTGLEENTAEIVRTVASLTGAVARLELLTKGPTQVTDQISETSRDAG